MSRSTVLGDDAGDVPGFTPHGAHRNSSLVLQMVFLGERGLFSVFHLNIQLSVL